MGTAPGPEVRGPPDDSFVSLVAACTDSTRLLAAVTPAAFRNPRREIDGFSGVAKQTPPLAVQIAKRRIQHSSRMAIKLARAVGRRMWENYQIIYALKNLLFCKYVAVLTDDSRGDNSWSNELVRASLSDGQQVSKLESVC